MKTNKRNTIDDDGTHGNGSTKSTLKSESLDLLYKKQLTDLRNLALRKAQPNDIEICRKWLKVFNKISNSEKMARNCLCALMQEQIKENGSLKEPFTNLQNCNRNLESVLNELDELLSSQLSNQSFPCVTDETLKSPVFEEDSEQQQQLRRLLQENQDILLKTEASKITSQLQSLRMQLTEKEIENVKLKEIAEKYRIKSESFEETVHVMKKSILENIKEIVLTMQQRGMIETPMKFFQHIFAHVSYDKEFTDLISKYDEDLQYVFQQQLKCDFNKRKAMLARYICRKFVKRKTKLREKFERRLSIQNESHKMQLKLAKLNSFSILRQIFINFHNEFGELQGWQILKALEDKYQSIVNEEMQ